MIDCKRYAAGHWMRLCPSALRTFFSIRFPHIPAHMIRKSIKVAFPACFKSGEPPFNIGPVLILALAVIVAKLVYCSLDFIPTGQTIRTRFLCDWHSALSSFGRRHYSRMVLEAREHERPVRRPANEFAATDARRRPLRQAQGKAIGGLRLSRLRISIQTKDARLPFRVLKPWGNSGQAIEIPRRAQRGEERQGWIDLEA